MKPSDITVIITSRERFSYAPHSIASLYRHTEPGFNAVYVDVNSSRQAHRELRALAAERGFALVRVDSFVSPNEARNIGLRYATGKYVVFVDNDVEYAPDWLPALVRCAEEEDAWVVGPLYLEGPMENRGVHMAGGDMFFSGVWGRREFKQVQRYYMRNLDEVPASELVRRRCDIIEFHCALVRRDVFDVVGAMDEGLLTTREHLDFCQRVLHAGGSVYFEPQSVITYRLPPPFALDDLPYFMLRWSDAWTKDTLRHFAHKYGIKASYVDRVAKNRRGRQALLFQWLSPAVTKAVGPTGAHWIEKALKMVEPIGNRVVVEMIGRRRKEPRWELVSVGARPSAGVGPDRG
jgi:GT2 family glycosyltransferase